MKYDLVIKAAWLVSPTESSWIENEEQLICIRQGKIELIEPATQNWKKNFKAKRYLDLSQHIVMPGMVNAHTHLPMTLFRGLAEDMDFQQWLNEYILPIEKEVLDEDFVRVGTELAAWECIQQGVTCVNDMYYFTDVVLSVLDKAGLRGFACQTFMSFPTPDNKHQNGNDFKILQRALKKFQKHARVRPAAGPHAPYTCSDELLVNVRKFANENEIPLHIHVSETAEEVSESMKQYKKSPVKRLYDLGVMDGPTSFAHGIHLSDDDINMISEKSCGIAHNPESNMKIRAGVCQVETLLKKNVKLGLGTDGAASNNNLSMLQEMDVGVKLQKLHGKKVTARDFLKMATLGSAQAIGLDHLIGSIEVGKQADIIALSLDHAHMLPLHDPVAQVVYSAGGGEVSHVICDGKILKEENRFLTLNPERIKKQVTLYQKKIQKFLSTRVSK